MNRHYPLEKITVIGFKSIESLEDFEIRDLNVLVGANGVGKSNFVSVFKFLRKMFEGRMQSHIAEEGGGARFFFGGPKSTQEMILDFKFGPNGFKAVLKYGKDNTVYLDSANAVFYGVLKPTIQRYPVVSSNRLEIDLDAKTRNNVFEYVKSSINSWSVYHFHDTSRTAPMKRPSNTSDNRMLREDASNIAAYLFLLKEKYPHEYKQIVRSIKAIAPFFSDFQLEPSERDNNQVKFEWKHRDTDAYFDASSLSDGTLRFICLATLLLQPKEHIPAVIIIDEPELGLHPHAIALLAELLQAAAKLTKVVISTQSLTLINHMDPQDLIIVEANKGASTFRRLGKNEVSMWLDDYSLGELIDKNIFGGTPE